MGNLDVKQVCLIWRILLKHAVKMDSGLSFPLYSQLRVLPMHALGQVSGPSKGGIPLSISYLRSEVLTPRYRIWARDKGIG
jgi:hypothetical protein